MIVCLTPPQMNEFGDLLGTPYAPVSKIAPVKWMVSFLLLEWNHEFDLVMIAEQFDESMLLLQNQLCWEVSDMTYLKVS